MSRTYKELLAARAAGMGVNNDELVRARRAEVRAAEAAEVAELVARDLDAARAEHAKQVEAWVADAEAKARPLHAELVKQREVVAKAHDQLAKATKAHAAELAKASALHAQIGDVIGENLSDQNIRMGYAGYPTDDDGNPAVDTYRRFGQVVLGGEVIGVMKDRPVE